MCVRPRKQKRTWFLVCVSHPEQEIECANTVVEPDHASTSEAGVPTATSHPQTDAGSAQCM